MNREDKEGKKEKKKERKQEQQLRSLKFLKFLVEVYHDTHSYCVQCKSKLDNSRSHARNNPLLKLYLCAQLGISVEISDRLCLKRRSASDYWKKRFAEITEKLVLLVNDKEEASSVDSCAPMIEESYRRMQWRLMMSQKANVQMVPKLILRYSR